MPCQTEELGDDYALAKGKKVRHRALPACPTHCGMPEACTQVCLS